MIASAQENDTKLEVNENYYRVPTERIKRKMILAGVFGKVNVAYNDFRGHGYHGIGLIRSYVGFDNEPYRFTVRKGFEKGIASKITSGGKGSPSAITRIGNTR